MEPITIRTPERGCTIIAVDKTVNGRFAKGCTWTWQVWMVENSVPQIVSTHETKREAVDAAQTLADGMRG